jgi:hypothetical protein
LFESKAFGIGVLASGTPSINAADPMSRAVDQCLPRCKMPVALQRIAAILLCVGNDRFTTVTAMLHDMNMASASQGGSSRLQPAL